MKEEDREATLNLMRFYHKTSREWAARPFCRMKKYF